MSKKKGALLTLQEAQGLPWVKGEGDERRRVWFVGEAPAKEEVRQGKPFVGPSGELLWQWVRKYLKLERWEVRVDNLFPFQIPDKKGKQVEEIVAQEVIEHFSAELVEKAVKGQPDFMVTLGRYSTRAMLGDVDMEWAHGQGFEWAWGVVIPVFHPAAGLHSPDRLQFTALDLAAAKKIIDGDTPLLGCEYEETREVQKLSTKAQQVAIDTEGTAAHPYSLQASTRAGEAVMVLAQEQVRVDQFRLWLEIVRPEVVMHNALHDLEVLREGFGIDIVGMGLPVYDTMSAAHVLQDEPRGLKPLGKRLLRAPMQDFDDVVGPTWEVTMKDWLEDAMVKHQWPKPVGRKKTIPSRIATLMKKEGEEFKKAWQGWEIRKKVIGTCGAPPQVEYGRVPAFREYALRDADVTLRAKGILQARIEEEGLERVMALDMAVVPFLDRVMRNGLYCNLDKLVAFHAEVQQRRLQSILVIQALVGDEKFNPASADQVESKLRPYLEKLAKGGRCRLTKSKKRYQVDSGVLEQLKDEDPLIPAVLEFRELDKLDSSYLSPLYGFLVFDPESGLFRLPLDLRHAYVVSGRLSGRVLTWPARTVDGIRLRGCFVAPPGWKLAGWDLSQIEMRLAAGFSRDEKMLKAFHDRVDLHTRTAAHLFGVPEEKVDKFTQRTPTKTVSYLILYGGSDEKMFVELKTIGVPGFDRARCHDTIEGWKDLYPGVWSYMLQSWHEAKVTGEVRNFLGRRRFLPAASLVGKRWPCAKLREEAGRQAGNFKFQAGAQDLLKRAEVRVMTEVKPALDDMGVGFEPCLQMHDEIIALVQEEHWEVIDGLMVGAMLADEKEMGVPLECEGKMAADWGGLK